MDHPPTPQPRRARVPRLLLLLVLGLGFVPSTPVLGADVSSSGPKTLDPTAVLRYGAGYRYPQDGWTVLHIEGKPYDRGYQHGRLMAPEIADYVSTLATARSSKEPARGWSDHRTLINALFLRKFDRESLEEMKGIAEGASNAGATFDGRELDLVDIAAVNMHFEFESLDAALRATPEGLKGDPLDPACCEVEPADAPAKRDHCSAFAATGPATADGKIVFGHITMFGLPVVRHYRVWLDIKPETGHRVFTQTYPGGIQSGMDYGYNDAGILLAETTIRQTAFRAEGTPLASRMRRALQDADTIDQAVAILEKDNNGLYTNEWLLGDTKTNEVAMFELGTRSKRLWRSSKNEWIGGTAGFYWGCNNGKDVQVRLDSQPTIDGRPTSAGVFRPSPRDRAWLAFYDRYKGKIDADFARTVFTAAPLAAAHSLDVKFTTTDLAKQMTTHALFGPPRGRIWEPTFEERQNDPDIRPLVPHDWTLLTPDAPPTASSDAKIATDLRSTPGLRIGTEAGGRRSERGRGDGTGGAPAWNGTILPASDADTWLAVAFAAYAPHAAAESGRDSEADALRLFGFRSQYLFATRRLDGDIALDRIRTEFGRDEWHDIAEGKGVLFLARLQKALGNNRFLTMMDAFGAAHAGKKVETAKFRAAVRAQARDEAEARTLDGLFDAWLTRPGLPADAPSAGTWSVRTFQREPEKTLIVYGTTREAHAQREAAHALREAFATSWYNLRMETLADTDLTDAQARDHHLILIGRPDSNAVLKRFASTVPVRFGAGTFTVGDAVYAHPGTAVVAAAANPLNARYSVLAISGLDADATYRVSAGPVLHLGPAEIAILPESGPVRRKLAPASANPPADLGASVPEPAPTRSSFNREVGRTR